MGFSRQEYWSGLPFPSPGDLPRGTRDQIVNIHWILEKARVLQKNVYFCFIDYAKAFDYVDHNKLCKILDAKLQQDMNRKLPDIQAGFREGR